MDIFTTPCGFDDEDRSLMDVLLSDAEHEFGTDGVRSGSESCGQLTLFHDRIAVFTIGQIADPDPIADSGIAILVTHLGEQWSGFRIFGEVIERGDAGVSLHVGLAGKDVDSQRRGVRAEAESGGEQDSGFHGWFIRVF